MMSYCTCLDIEVEKSYTPEQFAAVPKERWWARGDDKIERMMQVPPNKDSSFVRAALMIRKNGGNPESESMQPKILAYTACIKAELAAATRRRPSWGSRRTAPGAGRQRQIPPDHRPLHQIRRALAMTPRPLVRFGEGWLETSLQARRCRTAMRQRRSSLADLTRRRGSV